MGKLLGQTICMLNILNLHTLNYILFYLCAELYFLLITFCFMSRIQDSGKKNKNKFILEQENK